MSDTQAVAEKPKTKHEIHNILILDRSSSMDSVIGPTISGFNENIAACRKDEAENKDKDNNIESFFHFVTFSHEVTFDIWNKPLSDIKDLTKETYKPYGNTALYDAIGKSVTRLRDEINKKIESQDANVIVTIFTDGQENASKEFTFEKIASLRKELEGSRMWTFTIIGCSEETLAAARKMGFDPSNVSQYDGSAADATRSFTAMSASNVGYRGKLRSAIASKGVNEDDYRDALKMAQTQFFDNKEPEKKEPEKK